LPIARPEKPVKFQTIYGIKDLKIGWRVVERYSQIADKNKLTREGIVEWVGKGLVDSDTNLVYVDEKEIRDFVSRKIAETQQPEYWDIDEILNEGLEPVVKLELDDGSEFYWWNASFVKLS
jgi:hypothetical protein